MRFKSVALTVAVLVYSASNADTMKLTFTRDGKPLAGVQVMGQLYLPQKPFVFQNPSTDPSGSATFDLGDIRVGSAPLTGIVCAPNHTFFLFKSSKAAETIDLGGPVSQVSLLVRDGHGRPVSGAHVENMVAFGPDNIVGNLPPEKERPKSDTAGRLVLGSFPVGSRIGLQVVADGYTGRQFATHPVTGGKTEFSETLDHAALLVGRVTANGLPLKDVLVNGTFEISERESGSAATRTDADGRYRLNIHPGHCMISASIEHSKLVSNTYSDLFVMEGKEIDGLDFRLKPGVPLTVHVSREEDGKPIKGAGVRYSEGSTSENLPTDERGNATFYVRAGDAYFAVDKIGDRNSPNVRNAWVHITEEGVPDIKFSLPAALTMPPVEALVGKVVKPDGSPAEGATVEVLDSNSSALATTGPDGSYRFDRPIDAGSHVVARLGDGITVQPATVLSSPLNLKISGKSGSIAGQVTDASGKPMSNVDVSLGGKIDDAWTNQAVKSDVNGRYVFTGLPGGFKSFFVWMKESGYGDETIQPIKLDPGEQKQLPTQVLQLADGMISGKVLNESGKPMPNVEVSGQNHGGLATTDSEGRFLLTHMTRGKAVVIVRMGQSSRGSAGAETGQTGVIIKLDPVHPVAQSSYVSQYLTGHRAEDLQIAKWLLGSGSNISALRGKYVLLDFWGVHCVPCIRALPEVEALHKAFGLKGLTVYGVCAPDDAEKMAPKVLQKAGATYPNALDSATKNGEPVSHMRYGYKGIPHLILIGKDGNILVDTNDVDDVRSKLKELLG